MKKRTLGKNTLDVSALGFGSMGLSLAYGRPQAREAGLNIIWGAFETGVALTSSFFTNQPDRREL